MKYNPFQFGQNAMNIFKRMNPTLIDKNFKKLERFQQNHRIGVPNAILNWINQSGFKKTFGFNLKMFKIHESVEKRLYKNYPIYSKYLRHIANAGWTFINFERPSKSTMIKRTNMTNNQLNKSFKNALLSNSSYILNRTFYDLMDNLDDGHRKQVSLLRKAINTDDRGYILSPDILFPILEYFREYSIFKRGGSFKNKAAITNSTEDKKKKLIKEQLNQRKSVYEQASHDICLLLSLNEAIVLAKLYRGINFRNFSYKEMPYGRNSIEHGVFDPNNFTFIDFLKLILICDNISEDTVMNINN